MKFAHVTDGFPIQFKTVRRLIMSEDFWDTLALGGKDLSKMKSQYGIFVDTVGSEQMTQ